MARYKVQQQNWKHWPKVLVVEQWNEYGLAFGRYVPYKGTCEVECYDDGVDEGMGGEWYFDTPTWYLSCGHEVYGSMRPCYCSTCGRRVVG